MKKYLLTNIKSLEIIDNRGMPTIRTYVEVNNEFYGKADVECGSSKGKHEALELRDGDKRFYGKGVKKAINNIQNKILPNLKGIDIGEQRKIDNIMIELDGTDNKSNLGANAIISVSLAVAKVASKAYELPLYKYLNNNSYILPIPFATMINGGLHAGNNLAFQEFCILPVGADSFKESVRILSEINLCLRNLLIDKYKNTAVNAGEDGGFAPPINTSEEAMDILINAAKQAGYIDKIAFGLDVASTHFYNSNNEKYSLEGLKRNREEMMEFLKKLLKKYPSIIALEDPLNEEDFMGIAEFTKEHSKILIIGDDLFTTNIKRLKEGIKKGAGNAILIKPNMIGTLTETLDTVNHAKNNKYKIVVSERSGKTEDNILSDITVSLNAPIIKTGGLRGSDRGTNYNRFIEIEEELGNTALFAGKFFKEIIE